ncbi:MAG TPA: hypothetical protein VGS22_01745 [Thermoanaerobaculia bacterium]|jgi:hypothetical protein|nr:hypothetical protein [Thermoanaerobaculia bacterium]
MTTDRFSRISRRLPAAALLVASLLAPAVAQAGFHFRSTTSVESPRGPQKTVVEAWADGDKGRVDFKESANPITEAGTYLLTRDGGRTLILVNPEEKAYGEMNLDAVLGSLGAVMGGMGPMLKIEISAPKVETLLDEEGPTLLGQPTRHLKFRTAYQMKVKVFGMGKASDVLTEEEFWVTDRLLDKSFAVWLRTNKPKTGNADLDRLIAGEMGKVKGVPLKSVTVTTTTQGGKAQKTQSTMEVTALDTFEKAPVSFEVPAGYQQREMLPQMPTEGP